MQAVIFRIGLYLVSDSKTSVFGRQRAIEREVENGGKRKQEGSEGEKKRIETTADPFGNSRLKEVKEGPRVPATHR